MKASLKTKLETHNIPASATVSVSSPGGDLKLKASVTDATLVNGPSFNGLSLSLEKPGHFVVDYDVAKKDARFMFMESLKVLDKPLNLTYVHSRGSNSTFLDSSLAFDPANKISTHYALGSGNCRIKYTFVHGQGGASRTFEPCYNLHNDSWDFAVSQKLSGGSDVVRASYQTSKKMVGLEWSRDSKENGAFKVSTSFNVAEELKVPKVVVETTWNFDL